MSRYGEQLSIPRVGIVILSCLLAGCTGSSEGRGRIHGKVSIAGKPLATGQIRLFPLSGGIGADGPIQDGVYDIPVDQGITAGKYRVELSSERTTGRKVPDYDGGPGDMKDEVVEDLPAKFNSQSTLQIDYDPANKQSYDFDL
jgi:hypothetical protein